jgi:hypothetical protein
VLIGELLTVSGPIRRAVLARADEHALNRLAPVQLRGLFAGLAASLSVERAMERGEASKPASSPPPGPPCPDGRDLARDGDTPALPAKGEDSHSHRRRIAPAAPGRRLDLPSSARFSACPDRFLGNAAKMRGALNSLSAYSYRILYEIKPGDAIVVLAVIHKRRDLSPDEVL